MKRSILIEEAEQILQLPLSAIGYLMEKSPPGSAHEFFWFEKLPQSTRDMYRIIEFQLSGLDHDEITQFAVNLCRRPYRDFHDSENYEYSLDSFDMRMFDVRLAPCLWEVEQKKRAMDQWWYPKNSTVTLQEAYRDVLQKLLNYGIPFLESPESDWWSWAGKPRPENY